MLIKKLFSDASQANLAMTYREVRIKVHSKIADIYFNKECIKNKVTPHYARIKMNCNSLAAKKTKDQAEIIFVENMIKQLYSEKEKLNMQSYSIHLEFNRKYGHIAWNYLYETVNNEVEEIMNKKYDRVNNKLHHLIQIQHANEDIDTIGTQHNFQNRVINLTNIQINKEENTVLQYGLKHNFSVRKKDENDIIATDIEANVRQLRDTNQCAVRQDITKDISKINKTPNKNEKDDFKICIEIKKKLEENNSLALKADKSNAIVILGKEDYIKKTENFIKENNFKELAKDPTEKYKKELTETIKKCTKVIPEDYRQKMNIANSKAPVMKGIPKIHKKDVPIRPLVNFQYAPTYKVSKLLSSRLNDDLKLEYKYNVKNSYDFADQMKHIKLSANSRLISFDISNLYTNIPVNETVELIKCRLMNNGYERTYVNQIVKLLKIVLKQNYFRFNNRFYEQNDGLAMGSPLSAILSEVFLQYNEEVFLESLEKDHEILTYKRYVDDILIIYNESDKEEKDKMLEKINSHHPKLSFTHEYEEGNKINFLDLTLTRRTDHLEFDIYRKPTQTNTTINSKSVHPNSHKTAAFRSMLYRVFKIPLNEDKRRKEINLIKCIAKSNGFQPKVIDEIGAKIKRKIKNQENLRRTTTLNGSKENNKYVAFNYNGIKTQRIANRFKKYGMSVAFRTQNTIGKILHPKIEEQNKFDTGGIYKINCNSCDKFYIGQTVNFIKRFKNHISAWKNKKPERSNVAKHLIEEGHDIGNIEDNLEIIKCCKKGNIMNAWEELYIFKEKHKNRDKLINEQVNFDSGGTFRNVLQIGLPAANGI